MIGGDGSLTAIAARDGPRRALAYGLTRARAELAREPDLAAALIAELWQLADRDGDEFEQGEVLDLQLRSLQARAERRPLRWRPRSRAGRPSSDADRVTRIRKQIGDRDPAEVAGTLLGLAAATLEEGDRALGRELVRAATAIDPAQPGTARAIHMYLTGRLYRAQAAADEQAGRSSDALNGFVRAAASFACCAFPARAMTCLDQAARLAARTSETAEAAVLALAPTATTLQRQLRRRSMTLTTTVLRTSSGPLAQHFRPDVALLRDQIAKGLLFSAAISSPRPLSIDESGDWLLQRIDVLTAAPAARVLAPVPPAASEAMLASAVSPDEAADGQTAAERRTNLQRSFDEYLTTQLYSAGSESPFFDVAELASCLRPNAVLVSLFLGVAAETEQAAVHVQAVTSSGYGFWLAPLAAPAWPALGEGDGDRLTYPAAAGLVASLRRQLQEDPMFGEVDAEAGASLGQLDAWFGQFSAQLREWRESGYDHLIIWPHGPTHYLPWHLYRAAGDSGPLADHWTVTVVPALGLLGRPETSAGRHLLSVGCAQAGVAFGLPAVAGLPAQAGQVAAAFGTTALAEAEATPARVAEILPGSRYAHIATHASQLAEAPAFQCLYLTAGDDGEGRLFAYQIAGLDLRGVQLVTLCACETALGRFDVADNLRGLSAAFLAAGASSVVAALWPVAAGPASTFFTSLYEALAHGGPAVSAFRTAQAATRRIHPEYRDWGAFSFVGDWRI